MAGVRVHIATTEGPVLVQRLAAEPGLAEASLSAVCLDGTTTRLPITRAYTYFVRDHVHALSGLEAYRLDLDRRIDGGSSWTLGAWIAHLLHSGDRLAMQDDAAETAVFATGEVAFAPGAGRRVEVRPVGHVAEKMEGLAARLAEEAAAGRRVLVVVPSGNAAEAEKALAGLPALPGLEIRGVSDVEELTPLLEPDAADSSDGSAVRRRGAAGRRPWAKLLAVLGLSVVAGGAAAGYVAWNDKVGEWDGLLGEGRYFDLARSLDGYPVPLAAEQYRRNLREGAAAQGALRIEVAARRPRDGGSCAGLRFRGGSLASVPVGAEGGTFLLDRPGSVCGFAVRAVGEGGDGHAWLLLRPASAKAVREGLPPGRRLATGPAAGPALRLFVDLPLYMEDSWSWTVAAIRAPVQSEDVARLLAPGGGIGDAAALARLEAFGVRVVRARIALGDGSAGAGN